MYLKEICKEIVSRRDEDISIEVNLKKAEYDFKRAVSFTLANPEAWMSRKDFFGVVRSERLQLGVNCFMPDEDQETNDLEKSIGIYRPLVAIHISKDAGGSVVVHNLELSVTLTEFNEKINNAETAVGSVCHLHFTGKRLLVFPEPRNCLLSYIRKIGNDDVIWSQNLNRIFSSAFIHKCIDVSVISFMADNN